MISLINHDSSEGELWGRYNLLRYIIESYNPIANLRYPQKNKFSAGERRYSQPDIKRLVRISFYPSKIDLVTPSP